MKLSKKWLIPITVVCLLLATLVGSSYAPQSLGEIFDPSGNPFAHRFSDVKDLRATTFIVAASNSEHKYEADYYCSGANDHVQIQAALDALPATGGCIFLLDGTFTLGAQVARAIDDVKFMGCGQATLLNLDGGTAVITAGVQDGWLFTHFASDAGGPSIAGATQSAIRSVWIAGVRTDDPAAAAGGDALITVAANNTPAAQKARADFTCSGANDDATIEALVAAGVTVKLMVGDYVFGAALDIVVSNFRLEGSGPGTVIGGAIAVNYINIGDGGTALSHVVIADLKIDGTSQTAGHGIFFDGANGSEVDDCIIDSCIIDSCFTDGVTGDWNTTGHVLRVINCEIANCGDDGVEAGANHHNIQVISCSIHDNTDVGAMPSSGGVVQNCSIYKNGDDGIHPKAGNVLIIGNIIYDNVDVGILVTVSDVVITGNRLTANGGNGIWVHNTSLFTITGNYFWNPTEPYHIEIFNSGDGTITGNTFYDAGTDSIYLNGAYRVAVVSNAIFGIATGGYGINNQGTDNIIIGNQFRDGLGDAKGAPVNEAGTNTTIKNNKGYVHISELRQYIASLIQICGGDVRGLWPFLDYGATTTVTDVSRHGRDLTASANVQDFGYLGPCQQQKGRATYYDLNGTSQELHRADAGHDFSFANAAGDDDSAFSLIVIIDPTTDTLPYTIIGKYNPTNTKREWILRLDANGYLEMELYDESATEYIGREYQTSVIGGGWIIVIVTYDGSEASAGVNIYVDGVDVDNADHQSVGAYVAMEQLGEQLSVGYNLNAAAGENWYENNMTWPVVVNKELTEDEIWEVTQLLKGLLEI